jgi:hypothetical protein
MTKRGRPAKLTGLRQGDFCELLDAGLTRRAAAHLLGCVPCTISKSRERDPAFRKTMRQTERPAALRQMEMLQSLTPPLDDHTLHRLRSIRSGKGPCTSCNHGLCPGASPGSRTISRSCGPVADGTDEQQRTTAHTRRRSLDVCWT